MPQVKLSPLFNDQAITSSGAPASGYKVYSYAVGSSTPLATYTDSSGTVAQTNPVILNANGFPTSGQIWLQSGLAYKLVFTDASGAVIKTEDNISGINDIGSAVSQWQSSGVTPSYVSVNSFTLSGDQTGEFHVGRKVQCTVTAGTVYGTIIASAFAALTTVTVQMDSGSLDSGLSVVNLSIMRADKLALPASILTAAYGVRGLVGANNAATPLTKYDLSADAVTLRNAAGGLTTRFVSGTLTCDLGLTGPAANGRDQSAAFTANSWIYLYFIWNGTTLATLASTTAPASFTGSTLPTGFTHWCFATALRWNGLSNIVPSYVRGRYVAYDAPPTALSGGVATTFTAVSCASLCPPGTLSANLKFGIAVNDSTAGGKYLYTRTTGSSSSGEIMCGAFDLAGQWAESYSSAFVVVNAAQSLDYKVTSAATSGTINVLGYTVANGDA